MNKNVLIKVGVVLGSLFLISTVIPELLNASSDLAVFTGTVLVISGVIGFIVYFNKIKDFFIKSDKE